ncbi:hypothetical protein TWF718_003342 [Orbilia javanica]|uniref:Uncharacterized protein n=1 Tax=Orbilia javanica TaxID=47235 RepID=A0AAN8ML29_9PEZI
MDQYVGNPLVFLSGKALPLDQVFQTSAPTSWLADVLAVRDLDIFHIACLHGREDEGAGTVIRVGALWGWFQMGN